MLAFRMIGELSPMWFGLDHGKISVDRFECN